jgi:murein L,D-transpeptidase YafK
MEERLRGKRAFSNNPRRCANTMFKSLTILVLMLLAWGGWALLRPQLLAKPGTGGSLRVEQARQVVMPRLQRELTARKLKPGAPVFMRIFKEEKVLELWIEQEKGGRFELFKSYPVCAYSGKLGPKLSEGDRQAPEGFYFVPRSRMNPSSRFHLSFNLGYPNTLERSQGRTGSFLMVHGNCVSTGCYAMGDRQIEEIYLLADAALKAGQPFFRVHCFPFRMHSPRLDKESGNKWHTFWMNLKQGYDHFEKHKRPPNVTSSHAGYLFGDS